MKKYKIELISLIAVMVFSFTPTLNLEAQGFQMERPWYKVATDCGRYNPNCDEVVIMCMDYGNDMCHAFQQIPCEEACEENIEQ